MRTSRSVLLAVLVGWAIDVLICCEAFHVRGANLRIKISCKSSADKNPGSESSWEGVMSPRRLAHRVRKHRATRGRIAVPPKKTTSTHVNKASASRAPTSETGRIVINKQNGKGFHLPYESALSALQAYHAIHSNLVIPRRYFVPEIEEYPEEWHMLDLSSTVYTMKWWQRHVRQYPARVEELNKLGFIWERLQPEWNLVMEALVTFSLVHGHLMVPSTFIVPHGSNNFAKATWGIPLGSCVARIRSRDDFLRGRNASARRQQLDGLGFVWDVHDYLFRKFFAALKHFVAMQAKSDGVQGKRPLRVPSTFVVPSGEDSGWPRELWGYPLGAKCSAVRQKELYVKNQPERQRALAEMGFHFGGNASLGWLEVVHAAAIYSQMHGHNLDVPLKFVVPAPPHVTTDGTISNIQGTDDAWPWPEYLWGLPLGQRLKDVRLKGAYLSGSSGEARRAQLDALGFNWTPKRGRRKRVVTTKQNKN